MPISFPIKYLSLGVQYNDADPFTESEGKEELEDNKTVLELC